MNPKIMLVLWTFFSTVGIILIIYIIIKFLKKMKMKNNKLNTLLILSFGLFLASCQKEIANSTYDQKEIVKEIGFNMKTVDFNNVAEASKLAPLKFNSLEEAKKYFNPVITKSKVGSLSNTIK